MLSVLATAIFSGRQIVTGLISFFSTPLGQVVAIAGALVMTAIGTDVHARVRDHAVCEQRITLNNSAWQKRERDAAAAYEDSRVTRDREIGDQVRAGVDRQLLDQKARVAALDGEVAKYAKEHPNASPACRVSDDLVRRRDGLLGRSKK